MNRKKVFALLAVLVCVFLGYALVSVLQLSPHPEPRLFDWELQIDLVTPENGVAYFTFNENRVSDNDSEVYLAAVVKLFDFLFERGAGQYIPLYSENVIRENGKVMCVLHIEACVNENLVPPIRRDDIGKNFCFYCNPQVLPGPYAPQEKGKLTVILPEGYVVENIEHKTFEIEGPELIENKWKVTVYSDEHGDVFLEMYYKKVD